MILLALLAYLFCPISSAVAFDTFVSGLATPTGLAIHPNERSLYVKSGISGTVWKVPIQPYGTAGSIAVVTDQFQPVADIKFDAAGNLYGVSTDNYDLWRLDSSGSVCSGNLFRNPQATGIAVETPGLSSNHLFFTEGSGASLISDILSSFQCKQYSSDKFINYSCGLFRFLLYRPSRADLVGSWGNTVSSVNINDASCTTLVSNLAQPNGLAEDNKGNLYIADTGTGEIVKRTPQGQVVVIAEGLTSPTGLAFDSVTGFLFVSEATAGRITTLPADVTSPPTGTFEANFESPVESQVVAGVALIRGWAFGPPTNPVAGVKLLVDEEEADDIPFGSRRGDVASAYPNEPNALRSGFGITFNYGNLSLGPHAISVRVTNQGGQSRLFTHQVIVVKFGGFAFVGADISAATTHREGNTIVVEGVRVQDKQSGQQKTVTVRLGWDEAAQGFVVTDIQ